MEGFLVVVVPNFSELNILLTTSIQVDDCIRRWHEPGAIGFMKCKKGMREGNLGRTSEVKVRPYLAVL
jgi:hypothetical protein